MAGVIFILKVSTIDATLTGYRLVANEDIVKNNL